MKSLLVAALAASLVAAAPAPVSQNEAISDLVEEMMKLTTEQVNKFEVFGLGGMTLRADQVVNENFVAQGRGPRAYMQSLRKYSALGAAIPPELMCTVAEVLQSLGLSGYLSPQDLANCANMGTNPGAGTGTGANPGTGAGTGTGTGGGVSAGNGTTRGNTTGSTQGLYFSSFFSLLIFPS